MNLNDPARKALADKLPGEEVIATCLLVLESNVNRSPRTGVLIGKSVLGQPYFTERGLNFSHPGCLGSLFGTLLTVTDRRLVFHKPAAGSMMPKPGEQVGEAAVGSSTLTWWDLNDKWRVLHIQFDNETWIGQLVARVSGIRMKKPLAEADLLVQAWGTRSVEIAAD